MEIKRAIESLGALAHEARLKAFRLLVRAGPSGMPAGEIARVLQCPPQTLSFHLKELVAAGLVDGTREGRSIRYSLRVDGVQGIIGFLTEDCCQARRDLCAPVGVHPRTKLRLQGGLNERPSVLFLCARNSARSKMAEAFLQRDSGGRLEVRSAGLRPSPIHPMTIHPMTIHPMTIHPMTIHPMTIHPMTIHVMEEVGIDLSSHRAEDLGTFLGGPVYDLAIVVCDQAQEECRGIYPFALKRLYWPFEDPAAFDGTEEHRLAKFREVRDAIEKRIGEWLTHGYGKRLCAS
jgi:arsenate reductase